MPKLQRIVKGEGEQPALFSLATGDAYRQMRNYLAGRVVGATRDESLLQEVLKCLFAMIWMNRAAPRSGAADIATRYHEAFTHVRHALPGTFSASDAIHLDSGSIAYIDRQLQSLDLGSWERDPFGDAYEAFIGSSVRGSEGQFFTPQNAVELLVTLVAPSPGETVIDPACGSGGFLSATARRLLQLGATTAQVSECVVGVDKDRYLANLAAAHVSFVTLAPASIYCADSLSWSAASGELFPLSEHLGRFDVVLTNPPFGSRIVAASLDVQRSFQLGRRWRLDKRSGRLMPLAELQPSVPPQVLFVERCLNLVRPGGRVGMVVPESLISGRNYRHVVEYIRAHARIRAVIGMPESLFKTSGKGGTHTKTCLLVLEKHTADGVGGSARGPIFMAEAQWCGRDSRGRRIGPDELPDIGAIYQSHLDGATPEPSHLGYVVPDEQVVDNILAPRYYNPEVEASLTLLRETHDLVKVADLVADGLLKVTTGDEVGKFTYGGGTVPFVRTSDISNWEIKIDPKHCVSEDVYEALAAKQDVREGDILMVRDGTYLIGTCAFVTRFDTRIVFQSHLYKLRVTDPSRISPYLILAALSSAPVRQQIKARRFTQDIIDSLGDRLYELVLPMPKDAAVRERVTAMVEQAVSERIQARELARRACLELVGEAAVAADPDELM